jgi:hypothetical protein
MVICGLWFCFQVFSDDDYFCGPKLKVKSTRLTTGEWWDVPMTFNDCLECEEVERSSVYRGMVPSESCVGEWYSPLHDVTQTHYCCWTFSTAIISELLRSVCG